MYGHKHIPKLKLVLWKIRARFKRISSTLSKFDSKELGLCAVAVFACVLVFPFKPPIHKHYRLNKMYISKGSKSAYFAIHHFKFLINMRNSQRQ